MTHDRPLNLFETKLRICYCVGNGASSCQPCRDRREMQGKSLRTKWPPKEAKIEAYAHAYGGGREAKIAPFPTGIFDLISGPIQTVYERCAKPFIKPAPDEWPQKRILAVAAHLGLTMAKYLDVCTQADYRKNGVWHQSADFPPMMFWSSKGMDGVPLYRDGHTFYLLPAWERSECAGPDRCGTHGHFSPSLQGLPDPCTYCLSDLYHPDTNPHA